VTPTPSSRKTPLPVKPVGTGNCVIAFDLQQLLIRLDPLTAPRRTRAFAALCDQLSQAQACYPGTRLVLRYEVKPTPE
jgi:hypothetical protein